MKRNQCRVVTDGGIDGALEDMSGARGPVKRDKYLSDHRRDSLVDHHLMLHVSPIHA